MYNATPTAIINDPLIKVSVKPKEGVKFTFKVKNENKANIVMKGLVMLPLAKLNFKMNENGLSDSLDGRFIIEPNHILDKDIYVTFECADIGIYKMPICFFFLVNEGEDDLIIMKEMLVYVEQYKKKHEKVISPYEQQPVTADRTVPTTSMKMSAKDQFCIPSKDYEEIFERDLDPKRFGELTDEQKKLAADVLNIFKGSIEENYIEYFHHLLWYEETMVTLNLMKYNMSGVKLSRCGTKGKTYSLTVPGLAEKRPSLIIGDILHIKPNNQDEVLFEATVTDIHDNFALITGLDPEFLDYYNPKAKFDVRFFMSRMVLERMHSAVHDVIKQGQATRIFPQWNPNKPITPITSYFNRKVEGNSEQRSVVEHIVSGSSGVAPYLLFGPPGTGKTITIVEAVLQILKKYPESHILVCTDSNMAADHVATRIMEYAEKFDTEKFILRANSQFRDWDSMPECLQPYSNGTHRSNYKNVSISKFKSYSIVITTLAHAAKFGRELKKKNRKRFVTHLFIDEAAQASEPACLIPICGLLKTSGQLVLAGDPKQLGPIVSSHEVAKHGLGKSLMERLKDKCVLYSDEQKNPNYMVMLRDNFRSHRDILQIPSQMFYNGKLNACADADPLSHVDILGKRATSRAIVFEGILSQEKREGKSPSFYNSMELEQMQTYIRALINNHHVKQDEIGIIAPYIRQVCKTKKWLRKENLRGIEVGTVEGFQGKEKRVIIISTVRAKYDLMADDAKFQLGFLVDSKRFNVALTRAKAKVIVIGNPLCLERDEKWRLFMDTCRQFGTYFGFDGTALRSDQTKDQVLDKIKPIIDGIAKSMQSLSIL